MATPSPDRSADRQLSQLDSELKRLEAAYTMFFSGRLPRPPSESRTRVESLVRHCDRMRLQNYGDQFRFATLQARFASLTRLWDRGLRAREEGAREAFSKKTET